MARGEEKENSFASWLVTAVLIIVIVGAVCACIYVLGMYGLEIPFVKFDRASKFEIALTENNYQAAYYLYANSKDQTAEEATLDAHLNEYFALCFSEEYSDETWTHYRGIEIFRENIEQKVYAQADGIVQNVYDGITDTDSALVYLSRVEKFDFALENKRKCVEEIKGKQASDTAYAQGVEKYNTGEQAEAVELLKKVSPRDKQRYDMANQGIENCRASYGNEQLALARGYIDVGNLKEAGNVLNALKELFGDYPEADEMLNEIAQSAE